MVLPNIFMTNELFDDWQAVRSWSTVLLPK